MQIRAIQIIVFLGVVALVQPAPRVKATEFYRATGYTTSDEPSVTRDGRRVYFLHDSVDVYMYDRSTKRETRVLAGRVNDLNLSPSGDRLSFSRLAEGSNDRHIWTLPLDPRTGFAAGSPKRVSLSAGYDGVFSPDGRSIAFTSEVSSTQFRLMVMPAAGGPERTLVQSDGEFWPMQWSPDGASLYYALNVVAQPYPNPRTGFYRVSVTGGEPRFVTQTADWGAFPGLTPDGRYLVAYVPTWDSIMVTDSAGRRLLTYLPGPDERIVEQWATSSIGLQWLSPRRFSTYLRTVAGRRETQLADSLSGFSFARWSPDGQRVATLSHNALVIRTAEGRMVRSIRPRAEQQHGAHFAWSPDGRYVLLRAIGSIRANFPVTFVDVSTGTENSLRSMQGLIAPAWRSDSRAIIYAAVDTLAPSGTTATADALVTATIREISLDGSDRALQTVLVPRFTARFVNDSLLVTWQRTGPYRLINFRTGAEVRTFAREGEFVQPVPNVSANRRWIAHREQLASGSPWRIVVNAVDGSSRREVALSFTPMAGQTNPRISDDGRTVMMLAQPIAGSGASPTLYSIDVERGTRTDHGTLPQVPGIIWALAAVSPDGRTIAFPRESPRTLRFYEVDATELLAAAARVRR